MVTMLIAWILGLAVLIQLTVAKETEEFNVLIVLIDDLRTELGTYRRKFENYTVSFTPNLDRFAEGAVQFDRAYAQVALCGPSRASLFTGKKLFRGENVMSK